MADRKVLVTGGTGFLGSYLARKLVKSGDEVVLFNPHPKSLLIKEIETEVEMVRGDISLWGEVIDIMNRHRFNVIFHLGAVPSVAGEERPFQAYRVNVEGTFNILEASRQFQVDKVIFASTIATYGSGMCKVTEQDVQRPTTIYGVSKIFGERLGEYYYHKNGLDFRGIRFPSVIGAGRPGGGASAYSSLMIQSAALGKPYAVFVDEDAVLPILYVKDAVRSLFLLSETDEKNLGRRVYNIGGISVKAMELAKTVQRYLPKAEIIFEPDVRMTEIVDSWPKVIDESKAQKEWGWKRSYSLDEAVKDFIGEVKRNRDIYNV